MKLAQDSVLVGGACGRKDPHGEPAEVLHGYQTDAADRRVEECRLLPPKSGAACDLVDLRVGARARAL